ncbi:MAG: glycosyltransferase family 2 protein, partial [Cyanobacteriota bacterium]
MQASGGAILEFLDADTEPAPECLGRRVAQRDRLGGL